MKLATGGLDASNPLGARSVCEMVRGIGIAAPAERKFEARGPRDPNALRCRSAHILAPFGRTKNLEFLSGTRGLAELLGYLPT